MSSEAFPRVRRDLRYVRQVQDGTPVYIVKDPVSLKYFRFGELEGWLMQQMDGTRSFGQTADELEAQRGVAMTPASLEPFYRRLKEMGLAERTQAERSVLILEAMRSQRQSRLTSNGNTLLRMRFSLGDPDEFMNRTIGAIAFCWTPGFVIFSLALFLLFSLIVATHWAPFAQGMAMMYDPAQYTLGFFVTLYLVFAGVAVIHEFGHGYTCKRFGGEVHEIGAMFFYFSPAMYCNINDAWTFEKRSHRLWVTFAGGWIGLVIASLAALVWILAEPESIFHRIALATMLVGGGITLLLNFNPLIPLDGYYALMDWLEIPNLRPRSFEYLEATLKRSILGMEVPLPPVTPRERKVFLVYGSLAVLYTTVLLSTIGLWIGGALVERFGGWGWAIVLLAVWKFARKPLRQAARVLRVWAADKLPGARGRRVAAGLAGTLALLLLVLLLVPWTVRAPGEVVVEPVQRAWLRPGDGGWIESIPVAEGALVQAGEVVAVLRNPALELEWTHARAAVAALEREAAAARSSRDLALARRAELQLAAQRARFAELDRRRAALTLRAPFAAQVVTPHPDELIGASAAPGDSLLELWSTGTLRARVVLAERDAGGVEVGSVVGLKFPVRADWTWRTRVQRVSPATREGQVELLAPLSVQVSEIEGGLLRPGMVGQAKVVVQQTNLAGAFLRYLQRTIRTDWLL